ncbi:hypothetical protein HOLleu_18314 [Holothuria leucospilota]|uniref:Uncharacterized protein n=1 Tax=Holothuria leucospilota TaxID=206669 RepID=A0A9Q1C1L7_HOLLE|nr:hypothetical protein HOLleu_18314 [Holothuria leucospilota]
MDTATLGLLLSTLSVYTSDAFLPNLGKYSCVIAEPIAKDSIRLDDTVSQTKNGEWSLSYDISWSAPIDLYYGIYFAELSLEGRDNPLTPWSFVTCNEVLQFADELEQVNYKTEPQHLLHARFTSRYMFQVSYGDALPRPVPVSLGTSIFFETPDCYTVTGDVEFCSSQDVYRCGVPTNVRLVEVTPGLINGTVMASFEWASPVQVNSMATLVEYRLQIYSSNGDLIISDTVCHSENGPSRRAVTIPRLHQDEPLEEGRSFIFMMIEKRQRELLQRMNGRLKKKKMNKTFSKLVYQLRKHIPLII